MTGKYKFEYVLSQEIVVKINTGKLNLIKKELKDSNNKFSKIDKNFNILRNIILLTFFSCYQINPKDA